MVHGISFDLDRTDSPPLRITGSLLVKVPRDHGARRGYDLQVFRTPQPRYVVQIVYRSSYPAEHDVSEVFEFDKALAAAAFLRGFDPEKHATAPDPFLRSHFSIAVETAVSSLSMWETEPADRWK